MLTVVDFFFFFTFVVVGSKDYFALIISAFTRTEERSQWSGGHIQTCANIRREEKETGRATSWISVGDGKNIIIIVIYILQPFFMPVWICHGDLIATLQGAKSHVSALIRSLVLSSSLKTSPHVFLSQSPAFLPFTFIVLQFSTDYPPFSSHACTI